jgi:hypothetical protein
MFTRIRHAWLRHRAATAIETVRWAEPRERMEALRRLDGVLAEYDRFTLALQAEFIRRRDRVREEQREIIEVARVHRMLSSIV